MAAAISPQSTEQPPDSASNSAPSSSSGSRATTPSDSPRSEDGDEQIQQAQTPISVTQTSQSLDTRRKSDKKKTPISARWRDKPLVSCPKEAAASERLLSELDAFLKFESDFDGEVHDPLHFYRVHGNIFPTLTKLVRRLFCLPATSVPAECLFSKAGIIQTELRNRINPKLLEYYCFLNHNQEL